MGPDTLWHHIHAERAAIAATLRSLSAEQWESPSLCTGWSVRDVAAHVIAHPQMRAGEVARLFLGNLGRGYNTVIYRDVKERGKQSPERILADYEAFADSRAKVVLTTTVEPLIDALVHHQDIVRPLGLHHDMAPEAAVVALDRARLLAPVSGTWRLVRSVRMVATDVAWARGRGPVVEGPVQELLMLTMGRGRAARDLSGPGWETPPLRPGRRTSR